MLNNINTSFNILPKEIILSFNHNLLFRSINMYFRAVVDDEYIKKYVTRYPSKVEINEYFKNNYYNDQRTHDIAAVFFSHRTFVTQGKPYYFISMSIQVMSTISNMQFVHTLSGDFNFDDDDAGETDGTINLSDRCCNLRHFPILDCNLNFKFIDLYLESNDYESRAELIDLDPISIMDIIQNRSVYKNCDQSDGLINCLKNTIIKRLKEIEIDDSLYYYCHNEDEWKISSGDLIFIPDESMEDYRVRYYALYSFALCCRLNCDLIDRNLLECNVEISQDQNDTHNMKRDLLEPEIVKIREILVGHIEKIDV